jgi:hypothetical protein
LAEPPRPTSEGEEGAEQLGQEHPSAEVDKYAGGTAVSVIEGEGSSPTPKDQKLVEECVEASSE